MAGTKGVCSGGFFVTGRDVTGTESGERQRTVGGAEILIGEHVVE